MEDTAYRAIAIVGVGAVLPDAPNAAKFWQNIKDGRYSITDVSPDRWDPAFYYDPDPKAPDKTYSKIGGFVREYAWDPPKWHLPIPPRVVEGMDEGQKWAIGCTMEALRDYGYPDRPLDLNRTAVILGNAMAGEKHYRTVLRLSFPEYAHELSESRSFASLPVAVRDAVISECHERIGHYLPEVTEDTMPGELANCIAGRIANVFNFRGPNYVVDAACASAMAAISSAVEGLVENDFDAVITGGVDRNMGASTYIKFCKIGALSATGTRPYAEGADGFVMGEGAAFFVMKRLADAERDGDKIYAVLRGISGSSDGKGKGITAPNPIGQRLCIERAWKKAGLSPATATFIEGHGTSTRVGDVVEVESMSEVLGEFHLPLASVALGSVKSNIGHLKGAAGAAGMLKATLALKERVLPPSLHCQHPNPDINFGRFPLYVNTELKPWSATADGIRRAGVSAFGFGGTNFHAVLEEYIPHRLTGNGKRSTAVPVSAPLAPEPITAGGKAAPTARISQPEVKMPLRGALVIGAASEAELAERVRAVHKAAEGGYAPEAVAPAEEDLRAQERIAIDYGNAPELAEKSAKALKAFESGQAVIWKALRAQGIFRGQGAAAKVAFLYTGQGSQYVNMLQSLRDTEPIVAETFKDADRVLTPLLGRALSDFIFVDGQNTAALEKAEDDLRQTAVTQPAILATDFALNRLLAAYGIRPDMTMGHSLGEYGALVAAGALPFEDALEAVSARGREMTRVSVADNGRMAAVFAPIADIDRILKSLDGYVVIANINSGIQAVIGGASKAVEQAMEVLGEAGYNVVPLPVSHAFHTSIVAPASEPLRRTLERLRLESPHMPIVANVSGEFYPSGPDVRPAMLDILARQIASPVQFVKGLRTLYAAGARVFVEVGPKKALQGFVDDVLGSHSDVVSLFTNHPKVGEIASFNQALCGLYAAGLGAGRITSQPSIERVEVPASDASNELAQNGAQREAVPGKFGGPRRTVCASSAPDRYSQLGHFFAGVLEKGWEIYQGQNPATSTPPVVITGAALGLPGTGHVFDDANIGRMLGGEQFIQAIPAEFRRAMLDKHITRLVKSDNGGPVFESINDVSGVIKLAARGGAFDLEKEFGVTADRTAALDSVTQLAIAVGIDALRDAGIPLVMRYKTTSKGTRLPERWGLPDELRDDTGVIFASAFPGYDSFAREMSRYYQDRGRHEQLSMLENVRARMTESNGHSSGIQEVDRRIAELRAAIDREPYVFDRRFLFRTLSMGHSQFAEFIGARGPNTQVNAACASTTQAVAIAEDWIRSGHCRRVIVISADNVTSDHLLEWVGAGFLASGAAATDEVVEEAALPFDRRRHGMIVGMGAAALVVESADAARERGLRPICEVLSALTANSAFHGTRLDVQHISQLMEQLIAQAEARCGIERRQIAPKTLFVSHETYTPARGGSASAEIHALRHVFGDAAPQVVIANTKGFTGHAMGAGIEDVVAVKALETGCVPPVANFKEVDPALGSLNLSKGGNYPVDYALRLGAGFGSQISMTLFRWLPAGNAVRRNVNDLGYAYRIADPLAWNAWLEKIAGRPAAHLEVAHRTLRVRDQAVADRGVGEAQPARTTEALPVSQLRSVPIPDNQPPTPEASPRSAAPEKAESSAKPAAGDGSVKDRVLRLVSGKTGYPVDMLDLDLDLEADLGVDTVKQAEVFAAVREAYGIARDEKLRLRDFPTLAHVVRFVEERRPKPVRAAPIPAAPIPDEPAPLPVPAAREATIDEASSEKVLEIVAEKTGYPRDMLDLDLDLEADLGIDTVKQAEMFASVRAAFGIPRDENLKLRDFPTLKHVIQFARDRSAGAPVAPSLATSVPAMVSPPTSANDSVREKVLQIVAEKTGYPADMLDLDLDLEADLGIDTVKQAEMFASVRAAFGIPRDENLKLRDFPTLKHVIQFALDRSAGGPTTSSPATAIPATAPAAATPPLNQSALPQPDRSAPQSPEPSQPGQPGRSAESIVQKVLEIVAEKTGYPADMLDLDLDLEADLGIDTVKQAEMFASVRAAFGIPRDENLKLRDFPTLKHVIQFARERSMPTASPVPAAAPAFPARPIPASFDAANSVPRRVPVPALRPPLSLCKPTGLGLTAGSRVLIVPDKSGVADALAQRLKAIGVEVLLIESDPAADPRLTAAPIQGVFWLPALENEGSLASMDLSQFREALQTRVKRLYTTVRVLYEQFATPSSFLVAATRLGGQHGYDDAGAVAPLGGAVTGFAKAFKRERMDALVKAVDFEVDRDASEVADILIAETLRDRGAVEIGYKDGLRWTIGLAEQPAADGQPGLDLGKDTVFLITGAAGSIVSAITADLAAASGGTFYLLDAVKEPDPADPDLARFVSDKEGLKRDLFARIQARGERATPALVEKELAALERAQAARSAIDAVQASGGQAHYTCVDLTNARAVTDALRRVRETSARIDVLIHAAGVERSHLLPEKDPKEFDLVFDVKVDGWFNVLHAIGDMPLGATVVFSSVAGRFGNGGQADYSAANDLLCKITSSFRTIRKNTPGIAIDWTAWGGIGMATRGSIPKMMELAGIDMLPPEAGIPVVRRELTTGGTRGEIVVAGKLGALLNEWDTTGGIDSAAAAASVVRGPMIGKIAAFDVYRGLTIETTLDPAVQPFLKDHQIDGTPVLPGVMGMEAFAEAASSMLPGWYVEAVEDVNFIAPFKFYRSEPRTLIVQATFRPFGDAVIADCKLLGRRSLPNETEPQAVTYFTGRVRLGRAAPEKAEMQAPRIRSAPAIESADIYRVYFHGPAYRVLERAWEDGGRMIGQMAERLSSNHHPPEQVTLIAPRLVELCFQTAGLWELTTERRFGLPQHVDRVSLFGARAPEELAQNGAQREAVPGKSGGARRALCAPEEGPVYAMVSPDDRGSFDAEVTDANGNCYLRLHGYRTVEAPNVVVPEAPAKFQTVLA